jgi:Protein of unknown function (DUF1579)
MRTIRILTLSALAALLLTSFIIAQETPAMSEEDMQAMEDYAKMMAPGKNHETLEYFVGEWDVTAKMFMAGPGSAEIVEYPGTATYSWIMGGRFIRETVVGEFMGEPYHSEGYIGYDNYQKKYVIAGINTMNTGIGTMSGVYDKENNAYIYYGQMDEPMTGEIGKPVQYIMKIKDENHFIGEVHDSIYGLGDTMVMEILHTRK